MIVRNREKEIKEASVVIGLFLLIISLVFDVKLCTYLGTGFIFIFVFLKKISNFIGSYWIRFSEILSKINNTILLSVLFYLVLTPLAFFSRIFNKDLLKIHDNNKTSISYYQDRNHCYTKADLENMW